ncbi:inositol monophosphatase family protein [Nonomuraea diastatica]|uniref:inositol-phosphate phosphatase n=1 Tax=Nonomuraea diastatica TaxID=1848329 RepID=A0A4R4W843_9ACTN|nr:inositol monophosphatase family protein [Nonomuraea diastatica]TDD13187.1 inositol monophosphatase [Nonomuraea diastatica]
MRAQDEGGPGWGAGVPVEAHPALAAAAAAALDAYASATAAYDRAALSAVVADGADGTPTMRVDVLVEDAVLAALTPHPVNVLTEETGWVDNGSAFTLVMDPVDGSANAAAGVPLSAFSAAVAEDGVFTEALTVWLETGRSWWVRRGVPSPLRTTGRTEVAGAAVSLLRPHPADPGASAAWWEVARRAARVRILSTSCLEGALVAQGATDAFADAATDTHRLVDLAASVVLAEAAGGAVSDVFGRPITLDTDLTKRWSGIVAATPDLAGELAEILRTAFSADLRADSSADSSADSRADSRAGS